MPQRIYVTFDEATSNLPSPLHEILFDPEGPLQSAINLLSHALLVPRVPGNLTLPPSCDEISMDGPNGGKCNAGTVNSTSFECRTTEIPGIQLLPKDLHLLGTRESCESETGPCTEEGPNGPGEPVEYILSVTAFPGRIMYCAVLMGSLLCRVL